MRYTTCPWFRACDRRTQKNELKGTAISGPCSLCIEGRASCRMESGGPGCSYDNLLGSDLWKGPMVSKAPRI